jgi:preprotein translocase subunit YajC
MLFESTLHAEGTAPAAAPAGPPPGLQLGFFAILFVFAYFMLIRPQMKAQKERQATIKSLKEGDKVVLVSGVYATIVKVDDSEDVLTLKIAEGVNVKAGRSAVERLQK